MFLKLWSKVSQIVLLFSLYFSSLNLKYLKLAKMDITRFAMKLLCYVEALKSSGYHLIEEKQRNEWGSFLSINTDVIKHYKTSIRPIFESLLLI